MGGVFISNLIQEPDGLSESSFLSVSRDQSPSGPTPPDPGWSPFPAAAFCSFVIRLLPSARRCSSRDSNVEVSCFFRRGGGFHKPATVSACFLDSCPVFCPVGSRCPGETKPDGLGRGERGAISGTSHVWSRDVSLNVRIYVGTGREGVAPGGLRIEWMLFGPRQLGGSDTRNRFFFKKPAQLSCTLHTVCVCMCAVIFPPFFLTYLPCRGSQSPLSQLFLSRWRDLSVWLFVPALTRSHTGSFLTRQKDVLSRHGDSVEGRNR